MNDLSIAARDAFFERLECSSYDAAYACRSFPVSVLAGLGLRPVRIPLSVNDKGGTPVREDICPLVDLFSEAIGRSSVSLVAGMHTCDMTRRYFQEAARFTDTPVFQLQLPATTGQAAEDYFTREVERFCADALLNGISKGYSPEKAGDWYLETLQGMKLLDSLTLSVPPVALQYFYHFFRIMAPNRAVSLVKELVDSHPPYAGQFRLLLSGSPVIPGDDIAACVVEEAGGSLIPVNCTGSQMHPIEEPEDWSQASIARMHFKSQKCVRCRPNTMTYEHMASMADKYSACGTVVKTLTFCDLWYTEKVRMKNTFNSPVIVVDSGLKKGEAERTAMRIETFIQSLGAL